MEQKVDWFNCYCVQKFGGKSLL